MILTTLMLGWHARQGVVSVEVAKGVAWAFVAAAVMGWCIWLLAPMLHLVALVVVGALVYAVLIAAHAWRVRPNGLLAILPALRRTAS